MTISINNNASKKQTIQHNTTTDTFKLYVLFMIKKEKKEQTKTK